MGLAKKPVRFLFNGDSDSFRISVPGTEHHYRFYKKQPYLIKFDLDIEFFDKHLMFDRVDDLDSPEEKTDLSGEEQSPGEKESEGFSHTCAKCGKEFKSELEENESGVCPKCINPERQPYSKKELQKMEKSDIRDILKKLNPKKSCPVRKENIIKEILEAQEAN
ncbi:hypothetical protein LCGC14_1374790 [marine sediment metagenome]|uniref:Uncharacterized protein n=1 Tax=marine sediment metagenome TaxID=412755 RepID=A0A0F9MJJ6_9ZZZZ